VNRGSSRTSPGSGSSLASCGLSWLYTNLSRLSAIHLHLLALALHSNPLDMALH
jgi:hypothetical protein